MQSSITTLTVTQQVNLKNMSITTMLDKSTDKFLPNSNQTLNSAAFFSSSSAFTTENLQAAQLYDSNDPLLRFREEFHVPSGIYLCGNSLGLQPKRTAKAIECHMTKWAQLGVGGHFHEEEPWADIECEAATQCIPIVGAAYEHEIAIANSLTVNLHLMLTAFYRPSKTRYKILLEKHSFPSDRYALQSHITTRGIDGDLALVELSPRNGEEFLREDDILQAISDPELALVLLPGVQYYSGQVLPMAGICNAAKQANVPVGFDLAHAVGNVPLELHDWGADFAVWCHYKYLNSGPGAVAGFFLHDKHARADLPRLAGWWGHDRASRFQMPKEFKPQIGAQGFQLSNPPVLAIVPVIESLKLVKNAGGVNSLRKKSKKLTGFLSELVIKYLREQIDVVTPEKVTERGCQLSLRLKNIQPEHGLNIGNVEKKLGDVGIVCDVREPDVLRVAPTPLYNSFEDVLLFVCALERVLVEMKS